MNQFQRKKSNTDTHALLARTRVHACTRLHHDIRLYSPKAITFFMKLRVIFSLLVSSLRSFLFTLLECMSILLHPERCNRHPIGPFIYQSHLILSHRKCALFIWSINNVGFNILLYLLRTARSNTHPIPSFFIYFPFRLRLYMQMGLFKRRIIMIITITILLAVTTISVIIL